MLCLYRQFHRKESLPGLYTWKNWTKRDLLSTDYNSEKEKSRNNNQPLQLCFSGRLLERQVRIEGKPKSKCSWKWWILCFRPVQARSSMGFTKGSTWVPRRTRKAHAMNSPDSFRKTYQDLHIGEVILLFLKELNLAGASSRLHDRIISWKKTRRITGLSTEKTP